MISLTIYDYVHTFLATHAVVLVEGRVMAPGSYP